LKKNRKIFYLFLLLLIIAASWWGLKIILLDGNQLIQKKNDLASLDAKIKILNQTVEYYPVVKSQYRNVVTDFDTLQYDISTHDTYVDVLEKIRYLARKQGIQIISLSPDLTDSFPSIKSQLTTTQKYIERIPVQLHILGDLASIVALIQELAAGEEIINVGTMSIESELEVGGKLSGELLLYTYWLVDESTEI